MKTPYVKLSQQHVDAGALSEVVDLVWDELGEALQGDIINILDAYDVIYEATDDK